MEIPQAAVETASAAGAKMLQAGHELDKQTGGFGGDSFDFFSDMSIDDFKRENV